MNKCRDSPFKGKGGVSLLAQESNAFSSQLIKPEFTDWMELNWV